MSINFLNGSIQNHCKTYNTNPTGESLVFPLKNGSFNWDSTIFIEIIFLNHTIFTELAVNINYMNTIFGTNNVIVCGFSAKFQKIAHYILYALQNKLRIWCVFDYIFRFMYFIVKFSFVWDSKHLLIQHVTFISRPEILLWNSYTLPHCFENTLSAYLLINLKWMSSFLFLFWFLNF